MPTEFDAVVVGGGPNGLTAAARLGAAGRRVLVLEAAPTIGGGARTAELTEAGFRHDVCSAFHPLGAASPAFAALGLTDRIDWIHPDVSFAHPLDDGRAAVVSRDLATTAAALGRDGHRWRHLVGGVVDDWDTVAAEILQPVLHWPRHPIALLGFGRHALRSGAALAARFATDEGAAIIPGCAAHAAAPLEQAATGGLGLFLAASAHAVGWPVARGGSGAITDTLSAMVIAQGGTIECNRRVRSWRDVPPARAVLFDTSPRQLAQIADHRLSDRARRRLDRFVPGAGAVKLDYALHEPVPWTHLDLRRAGTVHVGGTALEIAAAERAVADGMLPARPYVLVGQQSIIDPSRAPAGRHTLWAYTHVPQGVRLDRAAVDGVCARVEAQIERFAPGFADTVLARHVFGPDDYESYNPNQHGGDFSGGAMTFRQIVARPAASPDPYRATLRQRGTGIYLCSASASPGPGVHGMCGWNAAASALRHDLRD